MTLSDIIDSPDEETLVFEGDRLEELLEATSTMKHGYTDATDALRMEGVTRVTISPVKALLPSKAAYASFIAKNTDAPCGYAFGREWFYQNADGNAPSLLTICGVKRPHLCEGCGNPVMGGGCTCQGRPVRK